MAAIAYDDRYREFAKYPVKLKQALNLVAAQIPDQWHNIGISLYITNEELEGIKKSPSNGGELVQFFNEVLVLWEKKGTPAYNWATLLTCISSDIVGNKALADRIAKTLRSSEIVLTSQNAFQLLKSCGFRIVSHWSNLAGTLGVSLDDRKRLRTQALLHNNYEDSLQECLDIWITNRDGTATWKELFQAVEKEEKLTASKMREEYQAKK